MSYELPRKFVGSAPVRCVEPPRSCCLLCCLISVNSFRTDGRLESPSSKSPCFSEKGSDGRGCPLDSEKIAVPLPYISDCPSCRDWQRIAKDCPAVRARPIFHRLPLNHLARGFKNRLLTSSRNFRHCLTSSSSMGASIKPSAFALTAN